MKNNRWSVRVASLILFGVVWIMAFPNPIYTRILAAILDVVIATFRMIVFVAWALWPITGALIFMSFALWCRQQKDDWF